jgi:hypothetical protein
MKKEERDTMEVGEINCKVREVVCSGDVSVAGFSGFCCQNVLVKLHM